MCAVHNAEQGLLLHLFPLKPLIFLFRHVQSFLRKSFSLHVSLRDRHMYGISVPFPDLLPDRLGDPDDIADRAVLIFHAHVHDTAIIWLPVKFSVDFHSAPAKFFPDIPGKF